MVIYDQDIPPVLYKFSDLLLLFSLLPYLDTWNIVTTAKY